MYNSQQNYNAAESGAYDTTGFADFSSKAVRQGFIRKVYGILFVQLLITFGFVCAFALNRQTRLWVANNGWLLFVALGVVLVTMIMLTCCGNFARKTPHNYIALLVFTVAEGFLVGVSASMYKWEIILTAVAITAVIVFALTLFAFQTKIDFTVYSGLMFVLLIVFMLFGFVAMFWRGPIIQLVYSCFGALLFSAYLVIDTQMIVGGTHKIEMNSEDYVFGALTLYLDIINIFIYLLQILSAASND